jgi:endonuclease/exonuclease/phosphatase family metal-dependent hydrolase
VGTDGRLSPERIARVIAQFRPDVVALQELDVWRQRSGGVDQAKRLAQILNMDMHFHPAFQIAEEAFGDAVLSRWPLSLVKAAPLSRLPQRPHLETRGALWVSLEWGPRRVHLTNTHLGLAHQERLHHARELCGPAWLGACNNGDLIIFCGDLNALPGSRICRILGQTLRNVQGMWPCRPRPTWRGRHPVLCIDHIFVSPHWTPQRVQVGDTDLARVASDHRPLIADLSL